MGIRRFHFNKSDLIELGEAVNGITLNRTLDAGIYDAKIIYETFSITDRSPIN